MRVFPRREACGSSTMGEGKEMNPRICSQKQRPCGAVLAGRATEQSCFGPMEPETFKLGMEDALVPGVKLRAFH